MRRGYGQYCPLALAAEILCERWTLLIVSRILDGCTQFNQIHRGVPRISPSLLSQRLAGLERAGIIVREPAAGKGLPRRYAPTAAARELEPIIMQIAVWGQNWSRDMTHDDLDPGFLVWSMHVRLDTARMPPGRTVLEFEFTGAPRDCRRFWLVNDDGRVEMCLKHPGFEIDLRVESDLRLFIEAWRGIRDLRAEIAARRVRVLGPPRLCRQFPGWLQLSALAPFPRKRPGREQRLAKAAPRSGSAARSRAGCDAAKRCQRSIQ
ncbi:MAG TPA: helix-turn-helix domain-containing protein [Steroidobacteraceae bacterium]|nr:helix-turn-helix domain-containing protein [Steroidobacteraceae bacterium]HNS27466.1 helix-turn-helix domain-containing protein [Steroidobacteraceae bacterium]